MIVIDSSAFSKFLLKEENWETVAIQLKSNQYIYAVDILVVETTNVIWKYLELYKRITEKQALELYNKMMKLINKKVIILKRSEEFLEESLKISINYNISVYDSLFLSLTKLLGAKLITSDKRQNEIARKIGLLTEYIE